MQWASWSDFWAMGGYGLYVWGSFGVTFLVIAIEVVLLRRHGRETIEKLKRMKQWDASPEGGEQ